MKIKWAPLSIPLNRRLQTLSAASWVFVMTGSGFICSIFFILLLIYGNIYFKTLCILYFICIYIERDLSELGGRGHGLNFMRENSFFQHFRDFFPVDLIKTAELTPNRNYLFACYPHGIICGGVFGNFVSIAPKFKKLFPGIRTRVLTLKMNFQLPIGRELLFSWGMAAASKKSLTYLLTTSNDPKDPNNYDGNTSTACIVVVGGAEEGTTILNYYNQILTHSLVAKYAHPKNYQIVIKDRKGFVKMAIRTGSALVPVFSFGEVDVFDQPANPPGSFVRRCQEKFKKITGVTPIIILGRGFLQYSFGFLPHRKPINVVVGAPIEVTKSENPSNDEVDKIHAEYMTALKNLFDKYKSKFIPDAPDIELLMP